MQMKGSHGSVFAYNSTWHACKIIFQREGIYGLYKGNVPNLVKVCLKYEYYPQIQISITALPFATLKYSASHLLFAKPPWKEKTFCAPHSL